jgi:sensor histidine kinase YesM
MSDTYVYNEDNENEDLDPEETQLPPMLLQPFVENAVVHGVANLTRPGKIAIHFAQKGNILQCTIEDNGIGREAAALRRQERKPGHQPAAVEITRERLKNMPGNDTLNTIVFSDIVDENKEVVGTRVVVSTVRSFEF